MIGSYRNFTCIAYTPLPFITADQAQINYSGGIKKQTILSTSYHKLKKFKISDTNLTFVHKLKGSILKKSIPKHLNSLKPIEKVSVNSSTTQEKPDSLNSILSHLIKLKEKLYSSKRKGSIPPKPESKLLPKLPNRSKGFKSCEKPKKLKSRSKLRELITRGIQVEFQDLCAWEKGPEF